MVTMQIGVTESSERYTKFADGSFIQCGVKDIPPGQHKTTVRYDIPFVSQPIFVATPNWVNDSNVSLVTGGNNKDYCDVYISEDTYGYEKARQCHWVAIGRWK